MAKGDEMLVQRKLKQKHQNKTSDIDTCNGRPLCGSSYTVFIEFKQICYYVVFHDIKFLWEKTEVQMWSTILYFHDDNTYIAQQKCFWYRRESEGIDASHEPLGCGSYNAKRQT